MTDREIFKVFRQDGRREAETKGSHIQLMHPVKLGKVTVPNHSGNIHPKTFKSIMKQSGLK